MECGICGKKTDTALMHAGPYCSPKHERMLRARRTALHDQLLAEPDFSLPDELDLPAFERFSLKVALKSLQTLCPKHRAEIEERMPLLLVPEEMALKVKEEILQHIPDEYVELQEARGHERLFHGGTFSFKRNIPAQVIIDALAQTSFVSRKRTKKTRRKAG
jgi:hypothetical protein